MHLYQSLGILSKENNKVENATVLFLRKKYNSLNSFCRGALNVILNDSPARLSIVGTRQLNAELSKL